MNGGCLAGASGAKRIHGALRPRLCADVQITSLNGSSVERQYASEVTYL